MGILEFNYSSLIEYLFNFCEFCTLCCLENLNRRIFFFGGTIYLGLRIVSYKWNNELGRVEQFSRLLVHIKELHPYALLPQLCQCDPFTVKVNLKCPHEMLLIFLILKSQLYVKSSLLFVCFECSRGGCI